MNVPEELLGVVRERGYRLDSLSSKELALPRESALQAIQIIKGTSIAVVGGDVLVLDNQVMRYTGDNWYCERQLTEDPLAFVARSQDAAVDFITKYHRGKNDQIFFLLVLSELGVTTISFGSLI